MHSCMTLIGHIWRHTDMARRPILVWLWCGAHGGAIGGAMPWARLHGMSRGPPDWFHACTPGYSLCSLFQFDSCSGDLRRLLQDNPLLCIWPQLDVLTNLVGGVGMPVSRNHSISSGLQSWIAGSGCACQRFELRTRGNGASSKRKL